MATTERHKLPATILSRCQQFVFRTIAPAEIHAHLKQIVAREGARIDDSGLSYIVRASEGSMRDAQSLLDQIISFGGQEVDSKDVRDVLGFIPSDILDRTLDSIAEGNSQALVETVGIVVDQGLSLQQYIRELIARMRDLLMIKLGLEDRVLGADAEKQELARRAAVFSEQDLIRYFDLLLRLDNDLRWTSQPRFHIEVGLVKLAKAGRIRDIEEVIRDLKQGAASATSDPPKVAARPAPSVPASPRVSMRDPAPHHAPAPNSDIIKPAEPPEPPAASPKRTDESLSSAREEPLVKRFLEVFRGDIAQVKPPKGDTQ
jgi:DNA polymerase-3 subunit gamma/tau